jgi:hypothetical protein
MISERTASAMKTKGSRGLQKLVNNQQTIAGMLQKVKIKRWILLCQFLDDKDVIAAVRKKGETIKGHSLNCLSDHFEALVKLWADPRSSWMVDLDGNAVGLIAVDAVYDRNGVQLGWWYGDHLRNRNGQVVLFVSHTKIEGLMMPAEKPVSRVPTLRLRSGKPNFERLGVKPPKKHEWADVKSLLFRDQTRRTLAQIKRVWALAAKRHSRTRGPKSTLAS